MQETQVALLARDGLTNPEIGARLFISAASEVSGFCTAAAASPAPCSRSITSDQDEPSA